MNGDEEIIRQTHLDGAAEFYAGNLDTALEMLWSDGGIYMPEGSPTLHGKAEIRAFYDELASSAVSGQLFAEEIVVAGEWAYERGRFTMKVTTEEGPEPVDFEGRFLTIWQRQPDDSWKVSRSVWNSNTPSPES